MATYVVRVWIPDRPGALGAVASRIGAVRGDLVGIEILERGAGMAIDELVVEIPYPDLVPLLLHEVNEVDGVAVEEVRELSSGTLPDPRLAALSTAELLVAQRSRDDVLSALVTHVASYFEATWTTIVSGGEFEVHDSVGECPPPAWTRAFVAGSRSFDRHPSGGPETGPDDIAWAPLERSRLDLVLGRPGRPVRRRERQQLNALARIADLRCYELARSPLRVHPGAG